MAVKARTQGTKLELFIPITKVDEENRLVYGVLAAEEVDNAGEIFDYATSKPLFEKWSNDQFEASNGLSKGNVRAMHNSVAAGKLTEISYDDDNQTIEGCAKVIDEGEWQKVLEGVYTGFSMGGRYAKRWQDSGSTRYTAQPVEVSLVDKPCIKSALFGGLVKSEFMLMKADGTVENRPFKGAEPMYVPTNDQILGKAQTLAKAAGKTDADWLDFSEQAKTDLIAEHDGEAQIAKTDDVPAGEEAPAAEAAPGADGEQAPEGEEAPAGTEAAPAGEEAPEAVSEEAAKADVVEPEQVWKAADGTTFAKKADCLTHNEKLAKAAPASLKDLVAGLQKTVAAAIDGEQEPQLPFDQLPLDQRLGKFADFLSEPDILAKGMYEVSRLSTTMRDCASLFVSVNGEAKREGDGSSVPGTILDAVGKLGEALIDMATEEVGELMSALRTQDEKEEGISYYYDDVYCHLAAQTLGLEKADATEFFNKAISISGKDMARLQKIHDHASALGATCTAAAESGDDAEVAAAGGEGEAAVPPAAKEEEDEAEKMAKAAGFPSENAMLKADLAKAQAEIDEVRPMVEVLAKQVADMLKKPQPRAAQTQVVEKGTGGEGVSTQSGEIDLSKVDPAQLAQAAIRMAQQNGRQVSMAR